MTTLNTSAAGGAPTLSSLFATEPDWVKTRVESLAPKTQKLLLAAVENLGHYFCVKCADISAGQPAAQKRALKVNGFDLGTGVQMVCPVGQHGRGTHYCLKTMEPTPDTTLRARYSDAERKKIKKVLGGRDAFTGAGSSKLEVDHRVPMARRISDEVKIDVDEAVAVRSEFCLLTRDHNLVKDRQCTGCIGSGKRPPFLGVPFYFVGDSTFDDTVGCDGCGWAYPEEWKERLKVAVSGRLSPRSDLGVDKVSLLLDALGLGAHEEKILLEELVARAVGGL